MKYKISIKNPLLGVPITMLDKYNPNQFSILGCTEANNDCCKKFYTDLIQHDGEISYRNMKSAKWNPMILRTEQPTKNYYTASNCKGYLTITYCRVFIRKKINK